METSITVTLFRPFASNHDRFSETIEMPRYRALNFRCVAPHSEIMSILSWLYAATNDRPSNRDGEQKWICGVFNNAEEYSISVGDVIQVDDSFYMCGAIGWKKIENFRTNFDF